MNVLMLGNGFDINYKLLTKYINFLNLVDYISNIPISDIRTVGDVVGAEELHKKDEDVAISYREYKNVYDNTVLEKGVIEKIALLKNNLLFSYLLKSFDCDIGWIDFEKEIAVVICAFQEFLRHEDCFFNILEFPNTPIDRYIVEQFDFFYECANINSGFNNIKRVKNEYMIEYPKGSGVKVIHKEKIVRKLEEQLHELAEGLQVYLRCFVDNVVVEACRSDCLHKMPALTNAQHIVTFNYTNTYEIVYRSGDIYHIHGDVGDRIILGISPDANDELDTIDTLFVPFKKYFQRVIYHSDDNYINWKMRSNGKMSLVVMGHSLDITDKDIIIQLFDAADDITILYYSERSEASMVTNLIGIYGKEQFDELRIKKRLRFLPQDAEYEGFAEDRQTKEMEKMICAISNFSRR